MRILLLGATGRTGRKVRAALLDRGEELTTLGRRAVGDDPVRDLTGDLMDTAILDRAVEGKDAVINCLLSSGKPPLCGTIAAHLAQSGRDLRYVTVGGAGVSQPGDDKGLAGMIVGWALKRLQPAMLADRQRELDLLRASALRWTMLRPPRLTDQPAAGSWQFTFDRPAKLQIARGDLAGAVIEALDREDLVGKAPFLSAA